MCTRQSTVCLITDLWASSIHPAPHEESETDNLPFYYHLQQKSAYSRKKNNGLLSYTSAAFQSLVQELGCQPWILINRPNHKKYIHFRCCISCWLLLSIPQEEPYVYPWRPHYYVSVIIATIFYFIPCGVIGLILLIQAQILHATGQAEQAERKREQSKCCTGLAIAAVFIIMVTLLIVFLYPTRDDSYDVDWSPHYHPLL